MAEEKRPLQIVALGESTSVVQHRATATWDGVAAEYVLRRPSDAYALKLQANEITLLMTRSIEPSSFIKQLAGGQPIAIEQDGWTLDVLAAGESLTIQSPSGDQGTERIALTITPQAVSRLAMTEDSLTSRVASRLNVDAPLLREIGFALRREMSAPKSFSQRFGESLAAGLTIEVIRQFGPENETSRTGPAGLSRGQFRRISSYINENLASAMPLRELAAVLGMSVSRFGRTFKAATGITPHQWILNARLRRAEEMLLQGDLALSEIAISTGFSEQSNFNRAFRRAVGISPGVWRRQFQR